MVDSKEALYRLLLGLVGENNPYRQYLNAMPVIMEDYELVKKDLEVLYLLKPIIKETIDMSNHGIPNNTLLKGINENELLKEWLENEEK